MNLYVYTTPTCYGAVVSRYDGTEITLMGYQNLEYMVNDCRRILNGQPTDVHNGLPNTANTRPLHPSDYNGFLGML